MSEPHHQPGWYPDPTGRFELRWFDGGWTAHVSSGGRPGSDPVPNPLVASSATASTGPVPTVAAPHPRRRGLVVAAVAVLAVAAVVVIAIAMSGSDDQNEISSGGTDLTGNFCSDAQSNWVRVSRAWRTADSLVETGMPYADWSSDQDLLSTTATMAGQLAGEAPDTTYVGVNMKTTYTQLSKYFTAAATLAAEKGGTEQEQRRVGQQAPEAGLSAVDTELTVTTGLPGSVC
jgi:hypothetical protein